MKKIYNAPEITIIMEDIEPVMTTASPGVGGDWEGGIDAKGAIFEDEDDDEDDWNGWN